MVNTGELSAKHPVEMVPGVFQKKKQTLADWFLGRSLAKQRSKWFQREFQQNSPLEMRPKPVQ